MVTSPFRAVSPALLVALLFQLGGVVCADLPKDPRHASAVRKGAAYLKTKVDGESNGRKSLIALALLKADHPASSPEIQKAIAAVQGKIKEGSYKPNNSEEHVYESGVDAMLLADAGGTRYRNELRAIVDYLDSQQGADGSWDYPMRKVGDTSMNQYALLGLWAAERVGVSVQKSVWDRVAAWHIRTQADNGGFAYHPGLREGPGRGEPTHNMTAGATGSLLVCRMFLYPNAEDGVRDSSSSSQNDVPQAFRGVLESVDLDKPESASGGIDPSDYKPQVTLGNLNNSIRQGIGWNTAYFRPASTAEHKIYYYYAMERMTALADITMLGKYPWFDLCANELLKMQDKDGSWNTHSGPDVGTSFAILFFTRSTAKLLRRNTPDGIDGGLLSGARGLPDDLANVVIGDGQVKAKKMLGPIDALLAELEKSDSLLVESAQQALVEKVQLGDREELIGQRERLQKLISHSNAEVRRTAAWALGRGGELEDAGVLIRSMETETNVDVLVEIRNALCYLSRRPNGLGLPNNPLESAGDGATDEERTAAMNSWKKQALEKWRGWYFRVRPYDERDDLIEAISRQRRR